MWRSFSTAAARSVSNTTKATIQNGRSISVDTVKFASLSPVDRIKYIHDIHGDKAIQLASMQRTSCVLMHLIHQANAGLPILFFDTEYLHQETYDLRDEFIHRYDLDITTIKPVITPEEQENLMGKELWSTVSGQPKCCYIRKEKPLADALKSMSVEATISGMMRAQGGARAKMDCIGHDTRTNVFTYNPLFDWTNKQLHDYTKEHNVPIHELYSQNYTSIGCKPCTTPVEKGEDDRAGRWRHLRELTGASHAYCGMNQTDNAPSVVPPKKKKVGYLSKKKSTKPPAAVSSSPQYSPSPSDADNSDVSEKKLSPLSC